MVLEDLQEHLDDSLVHNGHGLLSVNYILHNEVFKQQLKDYIFGWSWEFS